MHLMLNDDLSSLDIFKDIKEMLFFISKKSIVLRRDVKIATQDVQNRKGNTHLLTCEKK